MIVNKPYVGIVVCTICNSIKVEIIRWISKTNCRQCLFYLLIHCRYMKHLFVSVNLHIIQ